MSTFAWQDRFLDLFDRCLAKSRAGNSDYARYYSAGDLEFLKVVEFVLGGPRCRP